MVDNRVALVSEQDIIKADIGITKQDLDDGVQSGELTCYGQRSGNLMFDAEEIREYSEEQEGSDGTFDKEDFDLTAD